MINNNVIKNYYLKYLISIIKFLSSEKKILYLYYGDN